MRRDLAPHGNFEFNLRELGGAMGDFGTLFPLAIGLIAVCKMDPTSLFVMLGLTNIVTGLVYRLPMPVEPKKVISVSAIAGNWSAAIVSASGLGMGLIWLLLSVSGWIGKLARLTPTYLIRGIQLALAVSLGRQAIALMRLEARLGLLAILLILLSQRWRRFPAALLIVGLGIAMVVWRGNLSAPLALSIAWPRFALPRPGDVWQAMVLAGFAQIPLTLTNATLATSVMIEELFPDKPVPPGKLLLNMGCMNVASSLFGGMPMCHGSGGLASQYTFGARTGGANLLEGLIEVALGLFLGHSLLSALQAFPLALVGGMMAMVSVQLVRPSLSIRGWPRFVAVSTMIVSALTNMGTAGLAATAMAS